MKDSIAVCFGNCGGPSEDARFKMQKVDMQGGNAMAGRENRRVIRVHLEQALTVTMGSIGSDVKYNLETRDISNNGFFLDFEKPGRFPFIPSSIMEVWMDTAEGETIFFNGKMARVVYPTDPGAQTSGPGIAIRIIQIEPDQEQNLIEYISSRLRAQNQEVVFEDVDDEDLEEKA